MNPKANSKEDTYLAWIAVLVIALVVCIAGWVSANNSNKYAASVIDSRDSAIKELMDDYTSDFSAGKDLYANAQKECDDLGDAFSNDVGVYCDHDIFDGIPTDAFDSLYGDTPNAVDDAQTALKQFPYPQPDTSTDN